MEKIICNPLNLEYRYQYKNSPLGVGVFREAADPTMVLFNDKYLLFPSMSAGFWYSDDLYDWKYKATPELPIYDYAPDVRAVGGKIVFCASKRGEKCSIYSSKNPVEESFEKVSTPLEFWDPDIFQDDDGRVYLYWGCTTKEPIWGIELDAITMMPIGKKVAIVGENEKEHGWERVGENNKLQPPKNFGERLVRFALGTKPCIEGAFMTKYKGKYYLQYATPGTEHNVYSDGIYIGDTPLGPFKYQVHNPFSSKPGGFITAAGHGSTFQDKNGKWWHTSTMRISVNDNYERRVGLFPCDFDANGLLYCNQHFADYPFSLEESDDTERMKKNPEWMILSYKAKCIASSSQQGYEPEKAFDENIRTNWAAESDSPDEFLEVELKENSKIKAIQINFQNHKLPLPNMNKKDMVKENIGRRHIFTEKQETSYILEGTVDKSNWEIIKDNRQEHTDFTHDLLVFPEEKEYRYLRIRNMKVAMGGVPAISGFRVFGKGDGTLPGKVENLKVHRLGKLNIELEWEKTENAIGYNVRYGIAPDKLYSSWQLYDTCKLNLSMINVGQNYYVSVDSYNENGVTPGQIIQII